MYIYLYNMQVLDKGANTNAISKTHKHAVHTSLNTPHTTQYAGTRHGR